MSDPLAPLITRLIQKRPTCLLCIADHVAAAEQAVIRALAHIADTLQVIVDHVGECAQCGSTHAPVYSLRRVT